MHTARHNIPIYSHIHDLNVVTGIYFSGIVSRACACARAKAPPHSPRSVVSLRIGYDSCIHWHVNMACLWFQPQLLTRRKDGNTVVVTMTLQITSDKKLLNHFIVVFDPTWKNLMWSDNGTALSPTRYQLASIESRLWAGCVCSDTVTLCVVQSCCFEVMAWSLLVQFHSSDLEPHASPGLPECERRNPKPSWTLNPKL